MNVLTERGLWFIIGNISGVIIGLCLKYYPIFNRVQYDKDELKGYDKVKRGLDKLKRCRP